MNQTKDKFEEQGFAVIEQLFDNQTIESIQSALLVKTRTLSNCYAIRRLFEVIPELKQLLLQERLMRLISLLLGKPAFLTKAIYFDKPPGSNWVVNWHQDATINVQTKKEVFGFRAWRKKDGFYSVIPPVTYLENTVTIRLHLDPCTEENGALQLIPQSHQAGVLEDYQVKQWSEMPRVCPAFNPGDALVMSPLLLHASHKSSATKSRRIIHLEFNHQTLPDGLVWAEQPVQ